MRFKQNLPLLLVALTAAGVAALYFASGPSDADRIRDAVTEHLKTLPSGSSFTVFGDTADVVLPDGRSAFLLFEKREGKWAYSKDLGKEFTEMIQKPDVAQAVASRLGRRLQERFGGEVVVSGGMDYEYVLAREPDGLVGRMSVQFAYGGGRRGRYVERFRRENGSWTSQGTGSIFDSAASSSAPRGGASEDLRGPK